MARIRHLRRAPITEAIVDFRVSLAEGFSPERLSRAGDLLAREYPVIEHPQRFEARIQLSGEGEPKAALTTRERVSRGLWLRTEDKKSIAQFRVDGFTFNRLKPYTSWEKILPEALRLWEVYVGLANPLGITRLALRYINHLNLPRTGVELDDYIVTAPRVPPPVPQLLSSFVTRLVLERPDGRMKANVTQALEVGIETAAASLLFDIDVYRVGQVEMTSGATASALRELREYKNGIFFGSLTERFVEEFE